MCMAAANYLVLLNEHKFGLSIDWKFREIASLRKYFCSLQSFFYTEISANLD